jgi:LacI family transcriptional regulator
VRTATIRDVARAANVSVATVSRALNGSNTVSPPTRNRVVAAAGQLDYVPHSGARSLSTRRTDTIGVLLPDLHGEFFSELIRGIDTATRSHGLHVLLSHSHGDHAEAAAVLRAMRGRVDAMLLMSPYADEGELTAALGGAVPVVLVGGGGSRSHPAFLIDNEAGAFMITRHLLDAGHRRIVFVAGPPGNVDAAQRLSGYRAAIRASGGLSEEVVPGDFSEESGFRAARRLLAAGVPDAIFAANDVMAIGCLEAIRVRGLRVPQDIALAGFDNIPVARFLDPPLTTAGVPIARIGRAAVECCVGILKGRTPNTHQTFTPELIIRASSGGNKHSAEKGRKRRGNRNGEVV